MDKYVIKGGNPLVGEVEIGGAKNAALAILTAAIMTDETVLVENIPDVSDINVMLEAISVIGATVERVDRHSVRINVRSALITNSSKKSVLPIIFWERSLASIRGQRFRFRADATSGAVRSIST